MLKKLVILNYALVDHIEIDFRPGFTVLTGETGAGKSVVIGSLLLTLGGRADRDFIRHGENKAAIETTFELAGSPPLKRNIEKQLNNSMENGLRLKRELSLSGSSRAFINDRPENLNTLKELSSHLADFHSQQGQRRLLDIEKHIGFLDSFAGLDKKAEILHSLYADYIAIDQRLSQARNNAAAMREKLELINFQINELTGADINPGEEDRLDNDRKRLESVRTLMETGQTIITAISEADEAVLTVLSQLDRMLRQASKIDDRLEPEAKLLSESVINLDELSRNLQSYLSRLEDNPQRLEEINARLAELYRLRRKYDTDEVGLLDKLEELKKQSLGADNIDSLIENLSEKLAEARTSYHLLAIEVSEKRRKAAHRLEKKLITELADLAMEKARFKIDCQTELDDNGFDLDGEKVKAFPHGLENIEFLISTNPNEPLRPVAKIASGGEISRIMLALLTVIAGKYKLPTIIFDEIDTGIGGRTAIKLGQKLKELSKKHQIITISHLSAVAAMADHHLAVDKTLSGKRNIITITEVKGSALKKELARMSSTD
ncbi:MAG: DNA repair protein RecN [FCB group bacterium]|nr:DNA repair protein RecN [FCB group bacterium]